MLTKSQVKYIQSLSDKKFRKQEGVFVAEGPKIIHELLVNDTTRPVALYGTEVWWQQNTALQSRFNNESTLTPAELERISFQSAPNQVLGIFTLPSFPADIPFQGSITLLLDGIQDPGNLGTIIRIADWFGIRQVIAGNGSADVFNPKVVQSTMGSIARVKVLYEDLAAFILHHRNIPVYAGSLQGKPLQTVGKVKEGLLLIGNESRGLSEELLAAADYHITIPRYGHAESLNAAVAAGVILSHVV